MARLSLPVRNRFLTVLGNGHSVELAARHAGVSRNALYVRRRRDPHFAAAWDAMRARADALRIADIASRCHTSPTLDGVHREACYAGESIGHRMHLQSHRIFCLLDRLDRLAGRASADVGNASANPQTGVIFSGGPHHPM